MILTAIKNNDEYETLLLEFKTLIDTNPELGTADSGRILMLGRIISNYEDIVCDPIPESDPVDIIEFYMEQNNLTSRDLVQYIGSPSRVSEILNRKRELSKAMIRALHDGLRIPAALLLRKMHTEKQEVLEHSIHG